MGDIKSYLKSIGINFKEFTHPAVFTCEEADKYNISKDIKGIHSKNLFIKDRKSKNFYLVIFPAKEKLDMNILSEQLGEKVKFANENDLKEILGLTPGSVSPFGLINDKEHKVKIIIKKEIWESEFVGFHPNINTETLEITKQNFHKYIDSLKNELKFID